LRMARRVTPKADSPPSASPWWVAFSKLKLAWVEGAPQGLDRLYDTPEKKTQWLETAGKSLRALGPAYPLTFIGAGAECISRRRDAHARPGLPPSDLELDAAGDGRAFSVSMRSEPKVAMRTAAHRLSQPDWRCTRCGEPIDVKFYYSRVGIYCSYDCATSGRRDRYARTQGAARAMARSGRCCERCGAPIDARRSTKRYCSTRCRVAAFRAGAFSGKF
jgi:hypothetical protein